ncbi:LLM class flavin-dependent oxidoreductase [Actinospica robiniae]|uniref:LLM class flavin-dependent oxidoreductase n=1 Tax=Actinospica robiniae TaxID=304901 RepID=UPI00040549FA|nr:LLM class flavin-dependent oxidoreductase [Actinospica robiniae]
MYERTIRFGLCVTPDIDDVAGAVALARAADDGGLDLLGIQDHPYYPEFLDTLSLVAYLGALTTRVRLLTDVANLGVRPVPMLAKTAASLDALTGGRFELGIGSGASPEGVASLGGRPLGGAAAVNHVAAALRDLRETQPAPLWVGAHGTRMLGVIGQLADGWICPLNAYVPPSAVPERQAAIDRAASEAGRTASDVRRLYNVLGAIDGDGDQGLFGTSEHWARTLAGWTGELGFDTFVFWPTTSHLNQARRFIDEVVPRVRELMAGPDRHQGRAT